MNNSFLTCVLVGLFIAAVHSFSGCAGEERLHRRAEVAEANRKVDKAEVLARVDGVPITLGDVRDYLNEVSHAVEPTEALERLVEQELLAAEARRRGFASHAEVLDEHGKALARAILKRRIDEGTTKDSLDQDKLRAYYESKKRVYVHGVQRRVSHLLIATGKDGPSDEQARKAAQKVAKAARTVSDVHEFAALARTLSEDLGLEVDYEALPPFEAGSPSFVKEFVDGAFAVPGLQTSSEAIQTTYGWHVLYIVEEIPASDRSFEDVKDELASQVLFTEKKMRYQSLMQALERNAQLMVVESVTAGE